MIDLPVPQINGLTAADQIPQIIDHLERLNTALDLQFSNIDFVNLNQALADRINASLTKMGDIDIYSYLAPYATKKWVIENFSSGGSSAEIKWVNSQNQHYYARVTTKKNDVFNPAGAGFAEQALAEIYSTHSVRIYSDYILNLQCSRGINLIGDTYQYRSIMVGSTGTPTYSINLLSPTMWYEPKTASELGYDHLNFMKRDDATEPWNESYIASMMWRYTRSGTLFIPKALTFGPYNMSYSIGSGPYNTRDRSVSFDFVANKIFWVGDGETTTHVIDIIKLEAFLNSLT